MEKMGKHEPPTYQRVADWIPGGPHRKFSTCAFFIARPSRETMHERHIEIPGRFHVMPDEAQTKPVLPEGVEYVPDFAELPVASNDKRDLIVRVSAKDHGAVAQVIHHSKTDYIAVVW